MCVIFYTLCGRVHHIARTPFTEQAIVRCGCSSFPCRRSRNIRHCWACIILLLLLSFYTIFILYFVNNTLNRGRWTYFLPSRVCADVQYIGTCARARVYTYLYAHHTKLYKSRKNDLTFWKKEWRKKEFKRSLYFCFLFALLSV